MTDTRRADEMPLPGGDFRLFVTRLSFQGMLALGLLENPLTGTKRFDAGNARMVIDDLRTLRVKVRGNLDPDEEAHLDKVIEDLELVWSRVNPEPDA